MSGREKYRGRQIAIAGAGAGNKNRSVLTVLSDVQRIFCDNLFLLSAATFRPFRTNILEVTQYL
jgi:hypothetical protein